ncbi:unnamed protein product [Phaedon cochleariae]|uniref:PCI domain-containing protein n=1 Tax=Phaedon cochleariae TaxID=80249 RepID=A0A9N9X424_PHACE|nr:unnamed protein product [Phaedon cochleariae]
MLNDQIECPPLPSSPPIPRAPLLQTPKQFGNIRFQLNGKRLPKTNAILQLTNSPNSGAAKKKRKRNRNNQNNQFHQQNNFNAPPLPPPECKPAPPPENVPVEPPLPPLPVESKPPPPVEEPESEVKASSGTGNASDDWPDSLKDYVHRSYAKCITAIDKNQVEIILKGKITQAYQNGQLHRDWSAEALPNIHSERNSPSSPAAPGPVPAFTGQAKPVPGQLAQFQNGKKGLSPGLGARLGVKAALAGGPTGRSGSRKSGSRSPNGGGRRRSSRSRSRSRSRSPKRHRGASGSSSSSSDENFKPLSKPTGKKSKSKMADRLGPTKTKPAKAAKKQQKAKEKKAAFYSTFGSELEENSDLLQQRAARFSHGKPNNSKNVSIDKYSEDGSEFDWSDCHVVGTCREPEKSFLRLTKAPDASDVRPVDVLRTALQMVKKRWVERQDYFYVCDQLKSIRQDLTVQGVRNEFTVQVYETHARIALEKGDHEEFNQCQTQLKMLFNEIGGPNRNEFIAYRILYYIFTKNTLDIMTIMKSLSKEEKNDQCISFALKIRSAWGSGNFHKFFALYREAPLMTGYLVDWFIERERKDYLKCIIKSYRQNVSVNFVVQELAFKSPAECVEFLEPFSLCFGDHERTLIDCKSSMAALPNI